MRARAAVSGRALNTREVAEALGHSPDWFRRNRDRLERKEAFPKPIAGLGHRWSAAAVEAWLVRGSTAELRIHGAGPAEQRLAMRAALLAGRGLH